MTERIPMFISRTILPDGFPLMFSSDGMTPPAGLIRWSLSGKNRKSSAMPATRFLAGNSGAGARSLMSDFGAGRFELNSVKLGKSSADAHYWTPSLYSKQ